MTTKLVEFTFQQKVYQDIEASANVPAELETEDEILEWLKEHPETWNDENVVDEDIIDCDYASVELVK
jgi:hypothetical protein